MNGQEREVVVLVSLTLQKHREREVVAARLKELGLTAYGDTGEEARDAVKALFNKFINEYRDSGLLAKRLDHVGVDWYWRDEYPESSGPTVEDTSQISTTAARWTSITISAEAEACLLAA